MEPPWDIFKILLGIDSSSQQNLHWIISLHILSAFTSWSDTSKHESEVSVTASRYAMPQANIFASMFYVFLNKHAVACEFFPWLWKSSDNEECEKSSNRNFSWKILYSWLSPYHSNWLSSESSKVHSFMHACIYLSMYIYTHTHTPSLIP